MSNGKRQPDRLMALERWQSSELEDARSKMARLNVIAADRRATVELIEGDIATLHALARQQLDAQVPLDADLLLRMNEFNVHRQQQLQSARRSLEQATQQADEAQREVLRLFENLSVVQRLLERRQELAGLEAQRSAQKQLDEGALTRAPLAQDEYSRPEDRDHGS